jgi:hypothetical protein
VRLRLALVAIILLVAVAIGWAGIAVAHGTSDPSRDGSISAFEASAAEQAAHLHWDNPSQRMLFVAINMTNVRPGPSCPSYDVTAYSLFGIVTGRVFVDCEGIN